jgi:hypothetical protein
MHDAVHAAVAKLRDDKVIFDDESHHECRVHVS